MRQLRARLDRLEKLAPKSSIWSERENRLRDRLCELSIRDYPRSDEPLTPEERVELAELELQFPLTPDHPMYEELLAWEAAANSNPDTQR